MKYENSRQFMPRNFFPKKQCASKKKIKHKLRAM